jgi:hypothetical protein
MVVVLLIMMAVWASAWTLGGRIAHHQGRFRAQFVWTCLMMLVCLVFLQVQFSLNFLFPAYKALRGFTGLFSLVIMVVSLYGHLTIASSMPSRKRWHAAMLVTGVFVAVVSTGVYLTHDDFNTDLRYDKTILAVPGQWIPTTSVTGFSASIKDIKADLDKESHSPD